MSKDSTLIVALGGGGDSISAHLLASHFFECGTTAYVASLAWERFNVDPLPGPRRCSELKDLLKIDELLGEVTSFTSFPTGARINQSILVQLFPKIRHFILDPYHGVQGLINSLKSLCSYLKITKIIGIDVGGDVLAEFPLPSISSPLADAMLASSLYCIDPNISMYVCGIGLDGEIPMEQLYTAISSHMQCGYVTGLYIAPLNLVEKLLPLLKQRLINTEMTGLYLHAHKGMFGNVILRNNGSIVRVSLESTTGLIYSAKVLCEKINPLPIALGHTTSIQEASKIVQEKGFLSEFAVESDSYKNGLFQYLEDDKQLTHDSVLNLLLDLARSNKDIHYVAVRYISHQLKVKTSSVWNILEDMTDVVEIISPFVRLKTTNR